MAEAFAAVGLTPQDVEKPVGLSFPAGSGGVWLRCRALLAPADVVVLDEPFKGLDEAARQAAAAICAAYAGRAHAAVHHPRGGRRGAAGRAGVPPAGGGGTAGRTIRKGPKPFITASAL